MSVATNTDRRRRRHAGNQVHVDDDAEAARTADLSCCVYPKYASRRNSIDH